MVDLKMTGVEELLKRQRAALEEERERAHAAINRIFDDGWQEQRAQILAMTERDLSNLPSQ